MTFEDLPGLFQVYGVVLERWPPALRAAAGALLESSAAGRPINSGGRPKSLSIAPNPAEALLLPGIMP